MIGLDFERAKETMRMLLSVMETLARVESAQKSFPEFVLGEMERRMSFFQSDWASTTAVQLYMVCSVYDAHHVIVKEMSESESFEHGITWHNLSAIKPPPNRPI